MAHKERILLEEFENWTNKEGAVLGVKATELKKQWVMFTYDDQISLFENTKITGVNRHSNKRWYRWKTNKFYTFRVKTLKNGNKYLFLNNGKTKREVATLAGLPQPFVTAFFDHMLPICEELIRPLPEDILTSTTVDQAFYYYAKPAMVGKHYEDTAFAKGMKVSFRLDSVQDITRKVFKDRYRKDLVKAVTKCDTYVKVIQAAHIGNIKSEIPTDWLVEFLNKKHNFYRRNASLNALNTLSLVPTQHVRKFLVEDNYLNSMDALMMLQRLTPEQLEVFDFTGSVSAIHDRLTAGYRRAARVRELERMRDKLIPFEYPERIQNIRQDLWEYENLKLAESPMELVEWSDYMSNCISGYAEQVRRSGVLLLAYYENNTLYANMEIQSGKLIQLLGKYNAPLPADKFWKIVDSLNRFELLTSQDFYYTWGAPSDVPALQDDIFPPMQVEDAQGNQAVQVINPWMGFAPVPPPRV